MTGSVFWSHTLAVNCEILVKRRASKQALYLFFRCLENTHSCIQIRSSDYCDGVSVTFKYPNSYNYIFNIVHFTRILKGSLFGSWESIPVSHQNSQTSKEIGEDMTIFLGSSVLCWHMVKAIAHFCYSLNFHLWNFLYEWFLRL